VGEARLRGMVGTERLRLSLAALLVATVIVYNIRQDPSGIPTPTRTTDACKLQYSHFHVLFTLSPLVVLYFLAAPFLTELDWQKLYILPVIAFVWTTPWDNELVRKEAWWYPTSCVLARIGYVPVEEYAFVSEIMTTILSHLVLNANLCSLSCSRS
jgi:lycopene cyclase domain-containing protein